MAIIVVISIIGYVAHRQQKPQQAKITPAETPKVAKEKPEEKPTPEQIAEETKQKKRLQVATLLSQAETLKSEGLLDKSLEAVKEVLNLDPENEGAKKLQVELSSLMEKQKTAARNEQSFRNFSEAGFICEAKSDWEKAIECYTKALTFKADDAEAKDKLATCRHNLYLQKAEGAEAQRDLDSAIENYTKALSYKQVASTQFKLDSAKKALQAKIETEKKKREYDKWIAQAEAAEKEGNLPAAVKFYEKAQGYTDESLAARIDSLKQQIADKEKQGKFNQLLTEAKSKDSKATGKDALKLLEEALALYPDHQEALALKKKIQAYYGPSRGEVITNSIGMKLVYIPSGEFMIGSPDSEKDRDSDEGPQHRIRITKGFYMGITEVTQAQWKAVMGNNPSNFKGENLPVEQVSWNDAVEFCNKLSQKEGKNYRLPTEAEWEYACRAGSNTRFCFGDSDSSLSDYAWFKDNSGNKTHPVGQKKPNAFGLYDMHGNVWEWCQDWYDSSYYSESPTDDPKGPFTGKYRVLRGGSWDLTPWSCRTAFRFRLSPGLTGSFGFRGVVMDF